MGVRAVTGRGEVIRSGGRVLKNVTGLDLCKLLTGSHGTLGVITEITLKVLPAPEATGTMVLPGLDATAGVAVLSAALGSPFGVSGATWLPADAVARVPGLEAVRGSATLIRIEDFSPSVTYRIGRLKDQFAVDRRSDARHRGLARRLEGCPRCPPIDRPVRPTRCGASPCGRPPALRC